MPVTLAQAQLNTQADITFAVIENLRRYSWLLDQITFDDTANPTGGDTLNYGYTRLLAPRPAAFRPINAEFAPAEATKVPVNVALRPLGGAFNVDRVLANLGQAATNEVTFQMQQLLTATQQTFINEVINGDLLVNPNGFNGLDVSLTGTNTEYDPLNEGVATGFVDWTAATIITQALAMAALDRLDEFLSRLVPSKTGSGDIGAPGAVPPGVKAILGNTRSITRVRALARWAGLFTADKDDLGRRVERYGDWALVDLGDGPLGAAPIIPIDARDADNNPGTPAVANLTDLYAVTFGLDSFHAASMANKPLVQTWMPDFSTAGAVKTGEIEMGPCAAVLKNTRSCGVFRKIQV